MRGQSSPGKGMQTDVLIIGGGLSGLTAAWQLRSAGLNASLVEARTRFGGRIVTVGDDNGTDCDLGPSWYWPGQPLVAGLLNHFDIPSYEQFADGDVLFQDADGHVERTIIPSPMAGSRRIQGGIKRLTDAMVNEIDPSHRHLAHEVTGLSTNGDGISIRVLGPSGKGRIQATQVALAIPPRLAAELTFSPELPLEAMQALAATPTWMAGHAKFFAVYGEPFWRQKGLCGTAFSQRGPLAELHDASPNSGRGFSLFGFSGLDSERRVRIGQAEFVRQTTAQLAALFGDKANSPKAVHFQDWSTERFTAGAADQEPQTRHPRYGLSLRVGSAWDGRLAFISTETSFGNGGLIEGALEAGLEFSKRATGMHLPLTADANTPHTPSMDWDWL